MHRVGSNWIARIPHVSRMWDAIIFDLFQDIKESLKVELDTPLDLTSASETSLGLLPDTLEDVPPEVVEDVEEYDVPDGDVHPEVAGG